MSSGSRRTPAHQGEPVPIRLFCRLAAAAWIGLSVIFLLQPAELSPGISFPMELTRADIVAFWDARPDRSLLHVGLHVSALLTALVTLAAVATVAQRLGSRARWASWLAALGLATTAVSNVRYLALERTYARLHMEASLEGSSEVAMASASLALDPYGILEFGMLAIWIVAVTRHATSRPPFILPATAGLSAVGLLGMVLGAIAWPAALDIAPIIGTAALVAWLLLLPGSLGREGQEVGVGGED